MSRTPGLVVAGRVGRPHGLDGSFYVEAEHGALATGTAVSVRGRAATVERRSGSDARPIVRLSGVDDRDAAAALRGEPILVEAALEEDEYSADELVGCSVDGLGTVRRVIAAPSCDLLEVGDEEVLVPFVRGAVKRVDLAARVVEVDRRFLGLAD